MSIRLQKVGRIGGLFGELFNRPLYVTLDPVELDGAFIPAGHLTDLVSSPWWARWMLPLKHMKIPALKHDMRRRLQLGKSLSEIDKQFRQDMLDEGVENPARFLAYRAVRTNKRRG